MIIERASGQALDKLMRTRIIEPPGLAHTFAGGEAGYSARTVRGYIRRHGRMIDTWPWHGHYGLADSGIHSTPDDLARFLVSLFNDEQLLRRRSRQQMLAVSAAVRPPSDSGIGIYGQRDPWGAGRTWYAHDGIDPGYQADMMYLPAHNLTIVPPANASMGQTGSTKD